MERKLSLDTVGSQEPISEGTVSVAVKDTEMKSLEDETWHQKESPSEAISKLPMHVQQGTSAVLEILVP